MGTHGPKVGHPGIRDVQGKHAQAIAAVVAGSYAFIGGFYIAQILCGLLGASG